jgi:hypothetical protein
MKPNIVLYNRLKSILLSVTVFASVWLFSVSCSKEEEEEETTVIDGYELTQNETWSGNILLRGDIIVPYGKTLTISPGTKISVAVDNLVFDEGLDTMDVDFVVLGNLLINGEPGKIVEIKSSLTNPGNKDWYGIGIANTGNLSLNFCSICDADFGVFVYPSKKGMILFNHCLFYNNFSSITDFGNMNIDIEHCTFQNVIYGYGLYRSGNTTTINKSEFIGVNSIEFYLSGGWDEFNEDAILNIIGSNFSMNANKKVVYSTYFGISSIIKNTKVTFTGCYGNITYSPLSNGNSVVIRDPANSLVSGAGCGFSVPERTKSACINVSIPDEETIREHTRAIMERQHKFEQKSGLHR